MRLEKWKEEFLLYLTKEEAISLISQLSSKCIGKSSSSFTVYTEFENTTETINVFVRDKV